MTTPALRAARWAALVPDLPPEAPAQFEDLLDELERWNRRIKLTSPASREDLALRIVDDSLALVPFLRGPVVIDIGSGPGVPGLLLAIARPALEVRTVEAIGKKVAFTRAFLARHPALRVRPFTGRAAGAADEPWAPGDTVLSRALTAPAAWIPLGAPLMRPGGRLLVTLGSGTGEEADPVAGQYGLVPAGSWTGNVGAVRRAVRCYERAGVVPAAS
jgi:16S rRNA (guanine527-N7)-methyltransferase